jgi:integrase
MLPGTRTRAGPSAANKSTPSDNFAWALRWDHVDLDGDSDAAPAVPPDVAVWRSVRVHGETKTERSRRTLGLPQVAADVLRDLLAVQAREQADAGERWQNTGLVFTTQHGAALDAANVRKMFKRVCKAAGVGDAGRNANSGPRSSAS